MSIKNKNINFQVEIDIMKEGKIYVAFIPALDLSSHGDSVEDALKAGTEAAKIFIEEIIMAGTAEEILLDLGWSKIQPDQDSDYTLVPPEIIHATRSINISCHA